MGSPVVVGFAMRPSESGGTPRYHQNVAYIRALAGAGAVPLGIPLLESDDALRALYDRCDALLFAGGPDVDPRHYGQALDRACPVDVAPELDRTELRLAGWAVAEDRPVLGICRGAQLVNVALGGSLYQDLAVQRPGGIEHDRHDVSRDTIAHTLEVEPSTVLARATGERVVAANSLHHQAIRDLAEDLSVSARAPDGVIEGAEDPSRRFLVLVQSHPEELVGDHGWARRLFDELVAAAR
ncbi:MAG: gamma-glutamyl-gamma-aminobutyrate hydrolase family protein [Candidatus Dormibacteria bacterium]